MSVRPPHLGVAGVTSDQPVRHLCKHMRPAIVLVERGSRFRYRRRCGATSWFAVHALSFRPGQRHAHELVAAERAAKHLTFSCYRPGPSCSPRGSCDSCRLRLAGFADNQMPDPPRCLRGCQ